MDKSKDKVRLTIEGVNACDRYLLNEAAACSDETRGEIISSLAREYAERVFGPGSVAHMLEEFEATNRQQDPTNFEHPPIEPE